MMHLPNNNVMFSELRFFAPTKRRPRPLVLWLAVYSYMGGLLDGMAMKRICISCIQEALHREQMLENKLATLQRLVSSTQEASESGWQVHNYTYSRTLPCGHPTFVDTTVVDTFCPASLFVQYVTFGHT